MILFELNLVENLNEKSNTLLDLVSFFTSFMLNISVEAGSVEARARVTAPAPL
jgi:hypothetical protein